MPNRYSFAWNGNDEYEAHPSASTLTNPMPAAKYPLAAPSPTSPATAPNWLLGLVAALTLVVFFICEHNINISQAAAYTQSLDEMTSTAQGGNALRRIMFFLLGGLGITLAAGAFKQPWTGNPLLVCALLAVPCWCWASLTWAQDFGMCSRRLIVLTCFCVGAFGIGRRFSLHEITWIGFVVTLAASFIGVLAEIRLGTFRPWTGDYRFSGSLHPNTQGMYLAFLALASLTLARMNSRYFWSYLGCCGWALALLVLTKSRTANAGAIVGMACVGLLQTPLRLQLAVGGLTAWVGGMGYLATSILGIDVKRDLQSALFLGREEQAESFTGRGEIWPEVMHFIEQRPILGYGYESFWTPEKIDIVSTAVQWAVREAHCAYLEVILWLGVVGLALGLITLGITTVAAAAAYFRTRQPTFAMLVGLVGFALIDMLMESGMVVTQLVVFLCAAGMWNLAANMQANIVGTAVPTTNSKVPLTETPRIRPRRRGVLTESIS